MTGIAEYVKLTDTLEAAVFVASTMILPSRLRVMSLMVEPLVMQPNATAGGYMVDGDVQKIVSLVRQAVELGADIIKADPCDNVEEYHLVVEVAGSCPVLPRGGGRVPAAEVLARTKALMAQGAAGIVYGRNVFQHENPRGMTRALMAIVHKDVTLDEANELLHDTSSLVSSLVSHPTLS